MTETTPATTHNTLSLNAYALHRGCQRRAVQEAIQAGRLTRSVVRLPSGRYQIDAAQADIEWEASTRSEHVPISGRSARRPARPSAEDEPPSLGEARARLDMAKAELAEMELAERRGELLEARDVEARLVAEFAQSKNKLLGVPARARQQDPTLKADQLALLEQLIREALEGLAAGEEKKPARRRAAVAVG